MKRAAILAALGTLAACGKVSDLQPAPGHQLPPKAAMADHQPDAEELLTLPPQAAPARVDELMKRSQPRGADRFDLPPPSGGRAPGLPEAPATEPPASPEDSPPQ